MKTPFDDMDPKDFADLEGIVGPIDKAAGLSDAQMALLRKSELQNMWREVMGTPVGASTLLPKLIDDRHFLFNADAVNPDSVGGHFLRQYSMLATQSYKIFLTDQTIHELLTFASGNKITSFAGAGLNLQFPTANTWIEVILPEGKRAMVPPVGEGIKTDQMRLRINRIAMHVVCEGMILPFPIESDAPEVAELMGQPMFRKQANTVFFVDVEGFGIQTYAGLIQYGAGGARVFKVYTPEQAAYGFQGEPPTITGHARITNFAQFSCGMLAQTLAFFEHKGTMKFEHLRAYHRFEGQTGFTDDVSMFGHGE